MQLAAVDAQEHYKRGRFHKSRNDYPSAEQAYRQALGIEPGYVDAWISLGILLRHTGRHTEAEECQRMALRMSPGHFLAQLNLGNALVSQDRLPEAAECFRHALEQNPLSPDAHFNLGTTLLRLRDPEHPKCFHETLRLNPGYFEAAEYLGKCHFDAGEFDKAIATFQHARKLRPGEVGVRLDLAGTLAAARKFDQAIAEYQALLHEQPELPAAQSGLATVLAAIGQFAEARQLFELALARDPLNESIRFHFAPLLLRAGEFAKGWPHYELRWMSGESEETQRHISTKRWSGEPLAGKRLLITCEQGLGDELLFASLFPELLAEAQACTIECDERLETLFRRSFPTATLFPVNRKSAHWFRRITEVRDFDFWTPEGSIPERRRTSAADFPRHSGYLQADAAKITRWKERLEALGTGVKVGLSWRGGSAETWTEIRSLALPRLKPLLTLPGVHFVNLQYGETKAEIDALATATGIEIHHWEDALADFDETAALVSAVDIVISVCTAIVHLSGALGRPAWVMAPFVPEWRYGQFGSSMIWYPSVRVFRQTRPGDWEPVLKSVARHLHVLISRAGIEAQPESAQARYELGNAMLHAGDPEGESQLAEAMRLDPDSFDAPAALGRYLFQCGEYTRAAPILARAAALQPDNPDVRLELADSYLSSRQFEPAAIEFDRVRREHADRPVALAGLAVIHAAHGRHEKARGYFERAIERQPDNSWIGFQYSLFLLRCGDFKRGWQLYEVRRRGFLGRDVFARPFHQPLWAGESLAGRRLLITAEQGLGDEIMFASIYGELIREAAHCTIECDLRLEPLMRRAFPTATVFGADRRVRTWNIELERRLAEIPPFDCWIAAGTLPLHRRCSADQFPRHSGYLRADEATTARMRERLRSLGAGLTVGISWRGGVAQTNGGTRSMTLGQLRPILSLPGVTFVSLQYGDCAEDIAAFEAATSIRIHHWQDVIDDYNETAALVSALELVVSVCTSIVHLTGALGRPAWVMTPFVPEWRYGHRDTAMIWYPGVRLFRQPALDEWEPVIAEISDELRELLP